MRGKKLIKGFFFVLAILLILSANAMGAEDWYTCTISRVGGYTATNGAISVRLTDTKNTFTNVNFKIQEGRLNQILAILLTAASTGSTVDVKADPVTKKLSAVFYNGY